MEKFGEFTMPTTSNKPQVDSVTDPPKDPFWVRFFRYAHNTRDGTYFGRTPNSWALIILYAIVYLIFLSTYTMIFLYCSVLVIKSRMGDNSQANIALFELLTYPDTGVGLTGTPTHLNEYPLIWYREDVTTDYEKYIRALDAIFANQRTKRNVGTNLGPCAKAPYGYGDKPCIVIKINKQYNWAEKPLEASSPQASNAPDEVKKWMQADSKKYWLHCSGYHAYDKEHIGNIKYYPDPPGFDSKLFPVQMNGTSPMIAIQVTDFTYGISLAIECKLWYGSGVSTLDFMLYVMPKQRYMMTRTIVRNITK